MIPFAGSESSNPGTDNEFNVSLDYTHPVSSNLTIETGLKTIFQHITSNADVTIFDEATVSSLQILCNPINSIII